MKNSMFILFAVAFLGLVCNAGVTVTTTPQTCESQDTFHNAPIQVWSAANKHTTGNHALQYDWTNQCNYTTGSPVNLATCSTDQTAKAIFIGATDVGQVYGYLTTTHKQLQASQIAQAHSSNGSTSLTNVQAGNAVIECSKVLGCSNVTVSVPPFSVQNGQSIDQGVFTYSDSCPARVYWIKTCTTTETGGRDQGTTTTTCTGNPYPGGSSPLMMDLSGLGPFTADENKSGTDIYQMTGRILFKLAKTGETWKDTPLQKIAWPRKGSHMGVLVLPDDKGRIRTSDQLFGNNTDCGGKLCEQGFAALAYRCDASANGGNGDGVCDEHDAIFSKLRWLLGDPNGEHTLYTMYDFGLVSFDLAHAHELTGSALLQDVNASYRYESTVSFGLKALPGGATETQNRAIYDVFLAGAPQKKSK